METFSEFYEIILGVHIDKLTKEKREYIMYVFKVQDPCINTKIKKSSIEIFKIAIDMGSI